MTNPQTTIVPPNDQRGTGSEWWRSAVIYQVYPRSFADSNGDGVGDIPGITAHLPHLVSLGVDAVWLSPFYVSPHADAGYDVADYCDVDPLFGTLADFDEFLRTAHSAGLHVIVDLVPNHSSDEHPWFAEALAAAPGSPARDRYIFRDGKGPNGDEAPNNWESVFGGPAWEHVVGDSGPEQWYLHLFDVKQPDFNWGSNDVVEFFDGVLRFWLDRGVDGFRVDVAHSLVKADLLPDSVVSAKTLEGAGNTGPMWDQEGVHDIYRHWHRVVSEYEGDRMLVAEAWVAPADRMARYVRPDEMQQAFNFPYMLAGWDAERLRHVIDDSIRANDAVGAPTTWVLSNHDSVRHTSRFGLTDPSPWPRGISAADEQPDARRGLDRARAATLLTLALPGSAYLYQGEELGLPEHTELPASSRQDPSFARTEGEEIGRDGCRVPLPWIADAPAYGFGPNANSWLPQPDSFRALAVDRQVDSPASTLSLYKAALAARTQRRLGDGAVDWVASDPTVLDFRTSGIRVVINLGTEATPLPAGSTVLLTSNPDAPVTGVLEVDTAVWLVERPQP
jgi:alpha-glucosidase